jgi:hypothetical protein
MLSARIQMPSVHTNGHDHLTVRENVLCRIQMPSVYNNGHGQLTARSCSAVFKCVCSNKRSRSPHGQLTVRENVRCPYSDAVCS